MQKVKIKKDLTNMTFGKLKVLYRSDDAINSYGRYMAMWHCECSCENHTTLDVPGYSLTSGNKKSCGCIKKDIGAKKIDNLTGMTFGYLTVLRRGQDYIQSDGKKCVRWYCQCKCGNYTNCRGYDLKNGIVKSCGCHGNPNKTNKDYKNNKKSLKKAKEYIPKPQIINKEELYIPSTSIFSKNKFILKDDYFIGFDSKDRPFYFDKEDFDKVSQYTWIINSYGYIVTNRKDEDGSKHTFHLHNLVMGESLDGYVVDHIHGAETRNDNRKQNLRFVTKRQNSLNSNRKPQSNSGCVGVYYNKTLGKWVSRINYYGKRINLGLFDNKENAIIARKQAEKEQYGEYSYDYSQNIEYKEVNYNVCTTNES